MGGTPDPPLPLPNLESWKDVVLRGLGWAGGAGVPIVSGLAGALARRARIDAYFQASAATYRIGGVDVTAQPFFRISAGFEGRDVDGAEVKKRAMYEALGRSDKALNAAIHKCAYGRPTPEQLRMVTQALIDEGRLDEVRRALDAMPRAEFESRHGNVPRPLSDQHAIKLMQWQFGVGMDCAGYVQQAFLAVHGGTRKDWGFDSIGNENLYDLKGNPAFERSETPVTAEPGDLIVLKPPQPGDAGHTVLVRDRQTLTAGDRSSLTGLDDFAEATDTVHRIEVHASWGAGPGNLERGGVQSRTFLYNETTGKWADVSGGVVVEQRVGPYNGHPVEGVYHPRR